MIRNKLLKYVIKPTYNRIRDPEWKSYRKVNQLLKILERNQWLPYEKIRKIQQKKLKIMIRHIYENVEFYHRIFKKHNIRPEDIKTSKDLQKLPITTKSDLKKEFPHGVTARNIPKEKWQFNLTTGTSGTPFRFVQGLNFEIIRRALQRRTSHWLGLDDTERCAILWSPHWVNKEKSRVENLFSNFMNSPLYLSARDFDEIDRIKYYNLLKAYKPKAIYGYSSSLEELAKTMDKYNLKLKIDLIIRSGDMIIDQDKVENIFQTKVFNRYASREFGCISCECRERSGLHINAEHVFVEFLKEGEHVSEGELGEIIITDLDNTVMPFFRYRVGDAGRPSDDICPCGMGLPLMTSLDGRRDDFVITPKGKFIHGSFLGRLVMNIPHIIQFQFLQKRKDQLKIYLVPEHGFRMQEFSEGDEIIKKIQEFANESLDISIEFVDSIPIDKSGKYRAVKSEVSGFDS